MNDCIAPEASTTLALQPARELSGSRPASRSVRSTEKISKRWQPPEGLSPTDARSSEVPALRPMDVRQDSLVLPNRKNPNRPTKAVFLPAGQADLPGALLLWAREHDLPDHAPLFVSRKRGTDGGLRLISRQQAWEIVRAASERADVRVLALRGSRYGPAGEPAPLHPHLFRHARVRQLVRTTKNLPIVQKQAGWARLQLTYLSVSDDEVRDAMRTVQD
jgi:integrase